MLLVVPNLAVKDDEARRKLDNILPNKDAKKYFLNLKCVNTNKVLLMFYQFLLLFLIQIEYSCLPRNFAYFTYVFIL